MDGVLVIPTVLLLGYLIVVGPIISRGRLPALRARIAADPDAKARRYARGMARAWLLTALAAAIYVLDGSDAHSLKLVRDPLTTIISLGTFAALLPLAIKRVTRRFRDPAFRARAVTRMRYVAWLLPRTERERRLWVLMSLTAGITEELLFRGFLPVVLFDAFEWSNWFPYAIVTSIAFGFAHLYQGRKGMLLSGVLGFLFAIMVWSAGLLVAIVFHAAVNLRNLTIPRDIIEDAYRASEEQRLDT